MSPIIEAGARALCRQAGNPENATMDGKPLWQDYVPEVRQLLIAIRDATEKISGVGHATAFERVADTCERVVDVSESDAKAIFAAMLDAALCDDA